MQDDNDLTQPESDQFPWVDVEEARNRTELQAEHDARRARALYQEGARSCPKCDASPQNLAWFYFESPQWTWEGALCGRAGWMPFATPAMCRWTFSWSA